MTTVKTRVFRGYCRHNPQLAANLELFAAKRSAIEALFSEHPRIVSAEKHRVARYLRQFFERYQPGRSAESRLMKACLG